MFLIKTLVSKGTTPGVFSKKQEELYLKAIIRKAFKEAEFGKRKTFSLIFSSSSDSFMSRYKFAFFCVIDKGNKIIDIIKETWGAVELAEIEVSIKAFFGKQKSLDRFLIFQVGKKSKHFSLEKI